MTVSNAPVPLAEGTLELSLLSIVVFALVGALLSALTAALSEIPEERLMAIRDGGGEDGATAERLLRDRDVVRARLLSGRVLSVDTAVAQRCAALHVPDPRSERDALIAATAMVHNMTVVTRNVADFQATGVSLLNPWDTAPRPRGRGRR